MSDHSNPSSPIIVTRHQNNTNSNIEPPAFNNNQNDDDVEHQNENDSSVKKTPQEQEDSIAALYTATSSSYRHTLLVLIPYILSKCAIAAANAYLQYLFGDIQNTARQEETNQNNNNNFSTDSSSWNYDYYSNSNSKNIGGDNFWNTSTTTTTKSSQILAAEATVLQWEFLIIGFCMGGMRAISVMAGKYCAQIHIHFMDLKLEEEEKKRRRRSEMEIFLQNNQHDVGDHHQGAHRHHKQKHVGFYSNNNHVEENEDHQEYDNGDADSTATDSDENDPNSNCFYSKNSRLFRGLLKTLAFVSNDDVALNQNSAQKRQSSGNLDYDGENSNNNSNNDVAAAIKGNTGCDLYDVYPSSSPTNPTKNKTADQEKVRLLQKAPSSNLHYYYTTTTDDNNDSHSNFLPTTSVDEYGNPVPAKNPSPRRMQHLPSLIEFRMFVKLRSVFVSGFLVTTFWSIVATLLFVFTKEIFDLFGIVSFDHHNHNDDASGFVLQNIQDYCYGFSIGVLPTLWLYATEQFLLGCHASGTVFVYGVIYAGLSAGFSFLFASPISPMTKSIAFFSYHGSPLFGLGLGMSVAAWIGYFLLHIHICIFDKYIFRDLCSLFAVAQSFRERFAPPSSEKRRVAKFYSDWRASFSTLKTICIKYFGMSTALGLSNIVGLVASLVIAAVTLKDDNNDSQNSSDRSMAQYYSIAAAYYQTLGIAILGASSSVSALVSASNGMAKHFRDKFLAVDRERQLLTEAYHQIYSSANNNNNNAAATVVAIHQKKISSIDDAQSMVTAKNTNNSFSGNNKNSNKNKNKRLPTIIANYGEDGPRLKAAIVRPIFVVGFFAIAIAVPPLIRPSQFINFFGGDISQFNETTIHHFQGNGEDNDDGVDAATRTSHVYDFLVPACISFCLTTLAMCVSASLHALYDVILPLVFNVVTAAVGLGWVLGFSLKKKSSTASDSAKFILASYGNVVSPLLYLVCLSCWLIVRHFYKK